MTATKALPEKYSKALNLIKEGNFTYREIAKKCSITERTLYDLIEGNYTDGPAIQEKFTSALNDINKQRDKEIRDLLKSNKKNTHILIQQWLTDQKKLKKIDAKLMSTVVAVANALAKSTPNVEIGSFTYQKGLSAEDLYAEFKRLRSLASDRRGVQATSPRGTGEVCVAPRSGVAASEESEDIIL